MQIEVVEAAGETRSTRRSHFTRPPEQTPVYSSAGCTKYPTARLPWTYPTPGQQSTCLDPQIQVTSSRLMLPNRLELAELQNPEIRMATL
jgi:hypothetical protein